MTSQQFSKYLHNPALLDDQSLGLLEDLEIHYPYCQSGQLLLACNFYLQKNNQYPNQLKKAAAYAGDRCILKKLIGQAKNIPELQSEDQLPATVIPTVASVPSQQTSQNHSPAPEKRAIEDAFPRYERMTQEELLAIVKKRLEEIDLEKKREQLSSGIRQTDPEPLHPESRIQDAGHLVTKASLIEKFIREEPRISKPATAFFNPNDSANRSNFDDEEIVSETLAQLYAQQGNVQKAIHIYKKLSLLNQEKSRFFAAQIEKLNS